MLSKIALISIHPKHIEKILSGEKRLEFRRIWATKPLDRVLIYSTNPRKQIVAIANIKRTIIGSRVTLWKSAKQLGGGVTRKQLFDYLRGRKTAFALELSEVYFFKNVISPKVIFSRRFHAPQSFRYLRQNEEEKLNEFIGK
jgi:predicted transcriptional regulator